MLKPTLTNNVLQHKIAENLSPSSISLPHWKLIYVNRKLQNFNIFIFLLHSCLLEAALVCTIIYLAIMHMPNDVVNMFFIPCYMLFFLSFFLEPT